MRKKLVIRRRNFAMVVAALGLSLVFGVGRSAVATDNLAVERLREIQSKVVQVSQANTDACVAVSDGVGFGSGVIVSPDGLVLTAGHVMVEGDRGQYEVILPSGRTVKAKPLGKNLNIDSGMVQIVEKGPWPYVEIDRNNSSQIGDWVVSLGHSGGFELGRNPPVRTGRILARKDHQLLTDAVLIGGDSGGPLFSLDGKLIAIHSSIGDSIAENRHVTVDNFFRDWDRLIKGEQWGQLPELNDPGQQKRRGIIGVRVDKSAPNCLIKSVSSGSPADEAGIQPGDVVIEFNGISIRNGQHLIDVIKQKYSGDVCPMAILRNGNVIRFDILLQ